MARADAKAPLRVNYPNRPEYVLEIGEWLAHSHENNVVDFFASRALNCDELIDNFVCAQIARETFQADRAKFTSVSAAHLGRDTNRPTVRFPTVKRRRCGNQNRFDQISVGQTKKKFLGGVPRAEHAHDVNLTKRKFLRKQTAQRARQIGHFVDRIDTLFVKPIDDLASAIGGFSQVAKLLLKLA